MERLYRVGELARMIGVTVRTLHHYDQVGLLKPSSRSDGNQRLYSRDHLFRLQQILTLRYLGFSLAGIGELLGRSDFDLVASMRIQRAALHDRVSELARIEATLGELLGRRVATGRWDWSLVAQAATSVRDGLENKEAQMRELYSPEQTKQFEELQNEVPIEQREAVERGWTALLAEIRANHKLDPASPLARELAARWDELIVATKAGFQGRPQLWAAIGENYSRGRLVGTAKAPQPEDFAFIERVKAASAD